MSKLIRCVCFLAMCVFFIAFFLIYFPVAVEMSKINRIKAGMKQTEVEQYLGQGLDETTHLYEVGEKKYESAFRIIRYKLKTRSLEIVVFYDESLCIREFIMFEYSL